MTTSQKIDSLALQSLFAGMVPLKRDDTYVLRSAALDLLDYIAEGLIDDRMRAFWTQNLANKAEALRTCDATTKVVYDTFAEILRTFHDDLSPEQKERIVTLGFEL